MYKSPRALFIAIVCNLAISSAAQDCFQPAAQVPNFSMSFQQVNPNNLNQTVSNNHVYSVGEVFRYTNSVTSPFNINAYVKIEAIQNAEIEKLDNNNAGSSQRFQPTIRPDVNTLNNDREGWIEFSITFRKNNPGQADHLSLVNLAPGLRFRQFDIDGHANGVDGYFRETGAVTGQGSLLLNIISLLGDGGVFSSGGFLWKKVLGTTQEQNGLSEGSNVYYTSVYGPMNTVRFRMGYVFKKGILGGSNESANEREYAAEFGCFDISQNIPLPVKLLSFTANYNNQRTLLNWSTENEVNFQQFEVERSSNGSEFSTVGVVLPTSTSTSKQSYEFPDNLSSVNGNVFYYRLKMVDRDGSYRYSNVVVVRKDARNNNSIAINPNPVSGGVAMIKINSTTKTELNIRVIDITGNVVMKQTQRVSVGMNTVSVNFSTLKPGIYTLQSINGSEIQTTRFSVLR